MPSIDQSVRMSSREAIIRAVSSIQRILQCQLNADCVINRHTRGGCSACRLKKCFTLGMNPLLIRSVSQSSTGSTQHPRTTTDAPLQTTPLPQVISTQRRSRLHCLWLLSSRLLLVFYVTIVQSSASTNGIFSPILPMPMTNRTW